MTNQHSSTTCTDRYRCAAMASVNSGEQSVARPDCCWSTAAISGRLMNTEELVSVASLCAATDSSWSESPPSTALSRPKYFFFVDLVFTSRPWKPPPVFPADRKYTLNYDVFNNCCFWTKAPFIATQLNSTGHPVELCRYKWGLSNDISYHINRTTYHIIYSSEKQLTRTRSSSLAQG